MSAHLGNFLLYGCRTDPAFAEGDTNEGRSGLCLAGHFSIVSLSYARGSPG